ncbi:MAG TPA: winged helix-turn-helix domain-containing protein [Pyrinomonadaceae bacterium]|jgi:Tol biopolymer transport system component/DNA-binding winged helix-turn-helix (wHTH) protein
MSNKTLLFFKFDDFHLDVGERCLTFQDQPVSLTPKAFQTLVLLLRNHGKVVEKECFLNEVWADTFVEETTLSQNILTLRKALSRFQKDKEFIVTVPRRGYQFVGEVQEILDDEEILGDKEIIVVEKHTRTHLIAEQCEIHDSSDTNSDKITVNHRQLLLKSGFSPRKAISIGLLAFLAFTIGYFASLGFNGNQSFAESQFRKFRVDTIVADADIRNSVISPNGKYLALIQVKNGVQSLHLRQIENGNSFEIVPRINGKFIGAVFSPRDEQIYYSVSENSEPNKPGISTLYKVSVLGGASQEILHNIDSPVAISPDESRLAFVRRNPLSKETALILTDIEGKNERSLAIRQSESGFTNGGASWSPDGKLLSATVFQRENNRASVQVAVVNVESGEQRTVSHENWISAGQTVWLKDGSGILTVAYGAKSPSLNDELWVVSYPDGKSRFVTNGINGNYGISLNAATNSIVAVESNKFACFLTAPVDNLFKNTHVLTTISDEHPLPFGADWTKDGRIVYSAADDGNADIFTISEDGSERKQLTSDASAEISPKLSADGRFLIFMSNRTGQMDVWRSDANGTNTMRLTANGNVKDSIISPDGETVFYLVQDSESLVETLWRVSINGENPIKLTDRTTRSPRISPDGKTIACYISNPETNKMMLALVSAETGEVLKYPATPQNDDIPFLDWSKDGGNLFVVLKRGKPFSLWKLPLNGSQPEQLREWENDAIFRLAISRNGERVFYEVGNQLNSVVQFQNLDSNSKSNF